MDVRQELEKRIEKKRLEIAGLERSMAEARAYIQALTDALKLLSKGQEPALEGPALHLRPGSDLALAFGVIRDAGRALHIEQILRGINKPPTKENKASLGTSLSSYARRKILFTRPLPNTFGLVSQMSQDEPPDGFGQADDAPFDQSPASLLDL